MPARPQFITDAALRENLRLELAKIHQSQSEIAEQLPELRARHDSLSLNRDYFRDLLEQFRQVIPDPSIAEARLGTMGEDLRELERSIEQLEAQIPTLREAVAGIARLDPELVAEFLDAPSAPPEVETARGVEPASPQPELALASENRPATVPADYDPRPARVLSSEEGHRVIVFAPDARYSSQPLATYESAVELARSANEQIKISGRLALRTGGQEIFSQENLPTTEAGLRKDLLLQLETHRQRAERHSYDLAAILPADPGAIRETLEAYARVSLRDPEDLLKEALQPYLENLAHTALYPESAELELYQRISNQALDVRSALALDQDAPTPTAQVQELLDVAAKEPRPEQLDQLRSMLEAAGLGVHYERLSTAALAESETPHDQALLRLLRAHEQRRELAAPIAATTTRLALHERGEKPLLPKIVSAQARRLQRLLREAGGLGQLQAVTSSALVGQISGLKTLDKAADFEY